VKSVEKVLEKGNRDESEKVVSERERERDEVSKCEGLNTLCHQRPMLSGRVL